MFVLPKGEYVGTVRENGRLLNTYVLASAFFDGNEIIPVQLEVKELQGQENILYLSVCLKNKNGSRVVGGSPQPYADSNTAAPTTSTISISDIVKNVNPEYGDFLKYFPDSMLTDEQIEAKNHARAKEREYIEGLEKKPTSPKSDIGAIVDDIPMRHIDGSVRTYREYMAEQEAKKQDAPPPADTEAPTANPDVAAAVNAPGVERAEVIDLSAENALLDRLKGLRGAKKYKAVKDYILGALGDTIIFNDGIKAKVDKSDALHLAHKAGHVKVSYFSKIREIIDSAMLFLTDDNVTHNKFDAFRYYKTVVRLGEDEYPIYLNVGHAKNGGGYHLYDITKNVGEVEKQTSVFERVNDLRSKNDLPTLKSVPQPETDVKSEDASNSIVSDSMKPAEKFVSDKTWLQKKTGKLYKPDEVKKELAMASSFEMVN